MSDCHPAYFQAMKIHVHLQIDPPFSLFQISGEAYLKWVKSLILKSKKAFIDFISILIWNFVVKQL